jgi:succinyl-diaminopimelate desuccinylase
VRALVPNGAELEILGDAPPGAVATDSPLVTALLEAGATGIEPKQAWTNVADFTAIGIDAVNFGPGHPALAHRRDEHVRIDALVHAYETLRRFLAR